MDKKAQAIVGNGVSIHLLEQMTLPDSIEVISLNRPLRHHRTDLIAIAQAERLQQIGPDWPLSKTITSLDVDVNQAQARYPGDSAIAVAFEHVRAQGAQQVVMLGFDAYVMQVPDFYQTEPLLPGQRARTATIPVMRRWREQLIQARRQTQVVPYFIMTGWSLRTWIQAHAKY